MSNMNTGAGSREWTHPAGEVILRGVGHGLRHSEHAQIGIVDGVLNSFFSTKRHVHSKLHVALTLECSIGSWDERQAEASCNQHSPGGDDDDGEREMSTEQTQTSPNAMLVRVSVCPELEEMTSV